MDYLDIAIMRKKKKNSRVPISGLARSLRVSREVLNYRLRKLRNDGVILGFVSEIDIWKMGFVGAAVFVNVKSDRHEDFKRYLEETDFVSWVAELSGIWSFGLSIIGSDNEELDQRFHEIYSRFRDDIIDHRFTLHRRSDFYYEKYFKSMPETIKKKDASYTLDSKDKMILREISRDSRMEIVSLSQMTGLTGPAVASRIRKLENSGYIQKYSIFVDVSKLGIFQYSVFVINKDVSEKERLMKYLKHNGSISFTAEYIGDPFIEFGVFVDDPYVLREELNDIELNFPNNRVMEISLFQKEFVSVGPPSCVFE